jgi:hypothetical protein
MQLLTNRIAHILNFMTQRNATFHFMAENLVAGIEATSYGCKKTSLSEDTREECESQCAGALHVFWRKSSLLGASKSKRRDRLDSTSLPVITEAVTRLRARASRPIAGVRHAACFRDISDLYHYVLGDYAKLDNADLKLKTLFEPISESSDGSAREGVLGEEERA